MAAIAAREAELRQSLDAWIGDPEAGVEADMGFGVGADAGEHMVLAAAELRRRRDLATDITGEPMQSPAPLTNDDVLISLAEQGS